MVAVGAVGPRHALRGLLGNHRRRASALAASAGLVVCFRISLLCAGALVPGGTSCTRAAPARFRGTALRTPEPEDPAAGVETVSPSGRRPAVLGALAGGVGAGLAAAVAAASAARADGSRVPAPVRGKIAGGELPLTVGLGTCLVSQSDVEVQVGTALSEGYRVFDTAQRYMNENGLGRALRAAFDGGLTRDEVFVVTKVWPDNYGFDTTIKSVRESASKLGVKTIDLVLPHWPGLQSKNDWKDLERGRAANAAVRQETWRALEELRSAGAVAQIGVSNFDARRLEEVFGYANQRPTVNQIEVHPFNARDELVRLCQQEGVAVNSYSPLGGKGNRNQVTDDLLNSPKIKKIAKAYRKTPAQVILRWHLQRDLTPIPKTTRRSRMKENLAVFDFQLGAEDMEAISAMDKKKFVIMDSAVLL